MADVKISALLDLGTAPAANDYVPIVDASAAATKRVTVADLFTSPNVTGTLTSDGLTVDGQASVRGGLYQQYTAQSTTTDATAKYGGYTFANYLTAEENVAGILGYADASVNRLLIGGGTGALNAATEVKILTAANTTTTVGSERFRVSSNGDISFYEDTGTTAKFFWDASTERLGLGTTAPSTDIHVINSSADAILRLAGQTGARIQLSEADVVDKDWHIVANSGNFIVNETTDAGGFVASPLVIEGGAGNGALYLKSGGNLGIGTTSPSAKLHIESTTGNQLRLAYNSSFYWDIERDATTGDLTFSDAVSGEAMRIVDGTGDLLVGKTAVDLTAAGIELRNNGLICGTVASSYVARLNRNTTDGDIIEFRKDNGTVGSIGAQGGNAYIENGDTGLLFNDLTSEIRPAGSGGIPNDAVVTLGSTSKRFANLYLSGGVYLGGTGAANLLDDYEEGTFTPVVVGTTTAGTGTYTSQTGYYTKVGNVVTAHVTLQWSAHTGTGDITITGFPFNPASTHYFTLFTSALLLSSGYKPQGVITSSGTATLYQTDNSASGATTVPMDSGALLGFTLVYRTS